ncbi:MAG TPA: sugar ABC transporter permease [Polyangiaceae bacterium]|nr:sugar ABC transporter permease [Polyangiaceae bacterium]
MTAAAPRARPARTRGARRGERWWAYAFVAPPIVGFLVFGLWPMAASLYLSLTRYDVLTPPRWVGLDNYARLFTRDPFVAKTAWNTLAYLAGVPLGMATSLALALALNQGLRGERPLRWLFFLPSICSLVALSLVWGWVYHADYGLLNDALRSLGVARPPRWLEEPRWVKPALVAMGIWATAGQNMVLFLAALQGVPRHLLEAAELDGASAWQRFRHVTFPAISPTTFFVAVTGVIGAMQNFDQVYVMTRGGPEYASATYMLYLYQSGFQYYRMGYASAMAWALAAATALFTWLQFRASRRWVRHG